MVFFIHVQIFEITKKSFKILQTINSIIIITLFSKSASIILFKAFIKTSRFLIKLTIKVYQNKILCATDSFFGIISRLLYGYQFPLFNLRRFAADAKE